MKRRILAITIAVLMTAPLFISGCARDDVAIVRIQLENMPRSTAANSNSVFERVFRLLVPSAYAQWEYPNTDLQVILTAPDLEDVMFNMPYAMDSAVTIEVPSGPQRRITVYGFYYDGQATTIKNWGGHVELDLNPGDVRDVVINMLPIVAMPEAFYEGAAMVMWTPVYYETEGEYGITGYRIYRSDTGPNGQYNPIGVASGSMVGDFPDATVRAGNTYYYKISVLAGELEGELSDASLEYVHPVQGPV